MALGAGRGDVLKLVVVQGVRLAIVGVVIGAVGSFFITPVIKSELVNVSPTDPLSFIGVSIFLTGSRSSPATCPPAGRWPSIRWSRSGLNSQRQPGGDP